VDSSIAGLLNATTPLWTALIAMAVRLERDVTPTRVAGLAIGFVGALVIFEPWRLGSQVLSWGGLACLVAAACYGVSYVYMARYLRRPDLSPLALSAGQLVASAVLTALTLPLLGRAVPKFRADALVAVVVLGAIGTGLAYLINYQLIAESGASRTAVVTYLLPIVAVALGALVLGETLPPHALVGAAIVLAGVALTRRRQAPMAPISRS
jgi:drug/metabolite transporter (DMT)-like permease